MSDITFAVTYVLQILSAEIGHISSNYIILEYIFSSGLFNLSHDRPDHQEFWWLSSSQFVAILISYTKQKGGWAKDFLW